MRTKKLTNNNSIQSKEGYTFLGWDKSFDYVTSNLNVNAIWRKNTYKVYFKDAEENGGGILKAQIVEYNDCAVEPAPPHWLGHEFKNKWKVDSEIIDSDAISKYQINKDTTFVAIYDSVNYTVTYTDSEKFKSEILFKLSLPYGHRINKIPAQKKPHHETEGYFFTGFTNDEGYEIGDAMPAKDLTFVAEYDIKTQLVSFYTYYDDISSATCIESVSVIYSGNVNTPSVVLETGKELGPWTDDSGTTITGQVIYNVLKDMNFYAQIIDSKYVLSYNYIDPTDETEKTLSVFTCVYGEIISGYTSEVLNNLPIFTGYEFNSWNNEPQTTMPAQNITYIATYKPKIYNISWIIKSTSIKYITLTGDYTEGDVYYGEEIIQPTINVASGYELKITNKKKVKIDISEIPEKMPAENLIYYFEAIEETE